MENGDKGFPISYKELTDEQKKIIANRLTYAFGKVSNMRTALEGGDANALEAFSKSTGIPQEDKSFGAFVKTMLVALNGIERLLVSWSNDLSLVRWSSSKSFFGLASPNNTEVSATYLGRHEIEDTQ